MKTPLSVVQSARQTRLLLLDQFWSGMLRLSIPAMAFMKQCGSGIDGGHASAAFLSQHKRSIICIEPD